MTSTDTFDTFCWEAVAMPTSGITVPVRVHDLSPAQRNGRACVWCAADLTRSGQSANPVGRIASGEPLFCCRHCRNLGRRLPVFPEVGSV